MKNEAFKYTSPSEEEGLEPPMSINTFASFKHLVECVNHFQSEVHTTARNHGWHSTPQHDAVALALVHTEVSEAVEVLRVSPDEITDEERNEHLGEELADIIIRTLDFAASKGISLGLKMVEKHLKNQKRTHRHGGKMF